MTMNHMNSCEKIGRSTPGSRCNVSATVPEAAGRSEVTSDAPENRRTLEQAIGISQF